MHHSAQCSVVHDRVVQLSSAQLGLARLRSTWLSSTPLGSAQHGSWQQQDSSMAPLGLGSARHCQLCSAQLSSHTMDHGWPTILLDREGVGIAPPATRGQSISSARQLHSDGPAVVGQLHSDGPAILTRHRW